MFVILSFLSFFYFLINSPYEFTIVLHQAASVRCCRKVKKNEAYGKSQWVLKLDFFRRQMFHEVEL